MPTDEELIDAYRAGDERAFEALVERYLKSVYSFIFRFIGNERDAEDVVQETFLKAWKNIGKFSPDSAKFKTWLMKIARNSAIDHFRKRKELPFSQFEQDEGAQPFENLSDDAPSAAELFALAEDFRAVERAIEQLSPAYRETLLLYYGGDHTFDEVAAITGESVNTVKSRHRRAIAALRQFFGTDREA